MKTVFIYALCEPGTRTVRYIGKTTHPKTRLAQHLKKSVKMRTHLGNWLRSLLGIPPALVILSEVPEADGSAEEIRYIAAARNSLGIDLVNSTDGGDGVTMTPETRSKIGRAVSARQKGVPKSPETRAAISAARHGLSHSPETRAKMSAARKGRRLSLEHRTAISVARRGVSYSPERRAAQKKLWTDPEYRNNQQAARKKKI